MAMLEFCNRWALHRLNFHEGKNNNNQRWRRRLGMSSRQQRTALSRKQMMPEEAASRCKQPGWKEWINSWILKSLWKWVLLLWKSYQKQFCLTPSSSAVHAKCTPGNQQCRSIADHCLSALNSCIISTTHPVLFLHTSVWSQWNVALNGLIYFAIKARFLCHSADGMHILSGFAFVYTIHSW